MDNAVCLATEPEEGDAYRDALWVSNGIWAPLGDIGMAERQVGVKPRYDISIIRPEVRAEQIGLRGEGYRPERLAGLRKGLRALHTLELMAQTIYKFQLTKERSEMNGLLVAAMCNEMGHYQDFQVKLYEYGFRPSLLRGLYWLIGFVVGFGSRLLGRRAVLKTGVWVESKAVRHYAELLATINWDEETRKVIEKDQADEDGHISRWKSMLAAVAPVPAEA